MSKQTEPIQPKTVPLSHTAAARRRRPIEWRRLLIPLVASAAVAVIFVLFALVPRLIAPVPTNSATGEQTPLAGDSATVSGDQPGVAAKAPAKPPPFEALRRQQARTEAQDQLARFVELEIELKEAMQVEGWGADEYDSAKELAHAGDELFVGERYAEAIGKYRAAADALQALIDAGHGRFANALAKALEAIDARDAAAAQSWLEQARLVKAEQPELLRAEQRAQALPEIVTLFREAHNRELAGQWGEALGAYGRIRALDPETPGLDQAVAAARRQQSAARLQSLLSSGFAQLAAGRLSEAESSFKRALAMDPQNGAALGGLQQIGEQGLVNEIERLQRRAGGAETEENWLAAMQAFQAILALDANIQFARAGLARAQAQHEALAALGEVSAQAESLSSDRLYAAAQDTLSRAQGLQPRGPILAEKIAEVEALLIFYAHPIPVVLQSDNATEVLLSNVGPLGKFFETRLNLRPGAYTLVGSRDGCRDVRATITVHTGMAPVDIRCQEVLAR